MPNAHKILVVLARAIVLFFLQDITGLSSAMVAISAAVLAMLRVQPKIDQTLRRVK